MKWVLFFDLPAGLLALFLIGSRFFGSQSQYLSPVLFAWCFHFSLLLVLWFCAWSFKVKIEKLSVAGLILCGFIQLTSGVESGLAFALPVAWVALLSQFLLLICIKIYQSRFPLETRSGEQIQTHLSLALIVLLPLLALGFFSLDLEKLGLGWTIDSMKTVAMFIYMTYWVLSFFRLILVYMSFQVFSDSEN